MNQHGGVRRRAAKFGATTFALSTLRLQPMEAKTALRDALRCSRVIVTSPAAARFANAQIALTVRPGQRWFAPGTGSAAVLHRCGIDRVLVPERGADSESLLARDELLRVRGERIGLISAPGGRGLLASTLQTRGAIPIIAEVYRRQALRVSAARSRALAALPASTAVLITSSEAFSLLWQALDPPARARLLRRPCVASSERLAAQARTLGFALVLRAADARPASLLAALADHVAGPGFR